MKQFVVEDTDDHVHKVIGLYDKQGKDTDDLLKAETLCFEAPDGCHYVTPYCHGGVHVIQ